MNGYLTCGCNGSANGSTTANGTANTGGPNTKQVGVHGKLYMIGDGTEDSTDLDSQQGGYYDNDDLDGVEITSITVYDPENKLGGVEVENAMMFAEGSNGNMFTGSGLPPGNGTNKLAVLAFKKGPISSI